MDNRRDKAGNLLPDEERLNKYGKFLRSTSLDELLELINIFKGDMAIVGPRSLLVRYLPHYIIEVNYDLKKNKDRYGGAENERMEDIYRTFEQLFNKKDMSIVEKMAAIEWYKSKYDKNLWSKIKSLFSSFGILLLSFTAYLFAEASNESAGENIKVLIFIFVMQLFVESDFCREALELGKGRYHLITEQYKDYLIRKALEE